MKPGSGDRAPADVEAIISHIVGVIGATAGS
jgi:hypothetical protein